MKFEKELKFPEQIETFTTKNDEDIQYYIEIHELPTTYESWIYRNDCGIKVLMFGISKDKIKKQQYKELVESQIDEYVIFYEEEYL